MRLVAVIREAMVRGDGSDAGLLLSPLCRPPGSSARARAVAVLSLTLVHVFNRYMGDLPCPIPDVPPRPSVVVSEGSS